MVTLQIGIEHRGRGRLAHSSIGRAATVAASLPSTCSAP
jgi:hypothetical protein